MIGIFDSGIGGLTVMRAIRKELPNYDLLYFGDTARVPYGNKSTELIRKYAWQDAEFLLSYGAKVIIVACNTVSAIALDFLQDKLDIPIFGVIEPAVSGALTATSNGNIGVIGTRATVNSGVFDRAIRIIQAVSNGKDKVTDVNIPAFMRKNVKQVAAKNLKIKIKVFSQATPLLVPLVEEGYIDKPETVRIIKRYLMPLKLKSVDTLILGCTHYPMLKEVIQAKVKDVTIIDSASYVAKELKQYLSERQDLDRELSKRKEERYFVSDLTPHLQEVAQKFLGKKINLEQVSLD